jgi:PAS domain S-box-containing protein
MLSDAISQAAYMAHGYCLLWQPWLIAAHAVSDIFICAAYFAIPVAIWIFIQRRKDLELKHLAFMFAVFIFLCGLSHAVQAATLWWPVYETQAYVKMATAFVSLLTAFSIFPLLPKALAIPSPRQLQAVNDGLSAEIDAHRRTLQELQQARDELEMRVRERTRDLDHVKRRFEALVRASAQVFWSCDAGGNVNEESPSWYSFTGQSQEEFKGFGWLNVVHPDDRAPTEAAWRDAVRDATPCSVEFRLWHKNDGWRWMLAKGVPLFFEDGTVREWVGMNIDIDERKRSHDHIQLMLNELSHRAKNLLAVIYAMAWQVSRQPDPSRFLAEFGARIQGLSRSHDLLVSNDWKGVPLSHHLQAQLQPFCSLDSKQLDYSGPFIILTPAATQALGLAFHELATNAAKHGALTEPGCKISVSWIIEKKGPEPMLKLVWDERTVKATPPQPMRTGFGSTVLKRVVPRSLSGQAIYQIDGSSVIWELKAPLRACCEVDEKPVEPSLSMAPDAAAAGHRDDCGH